MECPDCGATLQPVQCFGVVVDECPRCKGRWFERDELRKARESVDDDLRWLDFEPFTVDVGTAPAGGKRCPRCRVGMVSVPYGGSGVVIEVCPRCRGTWLSSGEFERMVRHLEDLVDSQPASAYLKEAVQELREVVTGPEGPASELRDFLAVLRLLRLRIAVEHPGLAEAAQRIYLASPFK
jgi:Zn-finger nucleic acid-binding protein